MASENPPNPLNRMQLAALGLRMWRPRGRMTVQDGWLTIGTVIDSPGAPMEIVPRHRATEDHKRQLIAMAAQTLVHGRDNGWTHRPGIGWTAAVQIRYPSVSAPSSAHCASTAVDTSSSEAGTVRIRSGFSDPSGR